MELMNLNIVDGSLPKKCCQLVREWAELHQDELIEMWDTQNFHTIFPIGVTKMKIKHFEHLDGYRFLLTFENGEYRPIRLETVAPHNSALHAEYG